MRLRNREDRRVGNRPCQFTPKRGGADTIHRFTEETMSKPSRDFVLKRIHSLTGVIPIGAFLLVHFYNMSWSLRGQAAFDAHMDSVRARPYLLVFEILLIYVPILYHGVLGLLMSLVMTPSTVRYGYLNNWRYVLQRLSGVGVLLFVGAHVYKTRIEPWWFGERVDFLHMREGLSEPLTLAVYLLGIVGASYHLANGLWTFGITWGIWSGVRAQRAATVVSIVLMVVILAVGLNAVAGFLGAGIGGVAGGSLSAAATAASID